MKFFKLLLKPYSFPFLFNTILDLFFTVILFKNARIVRRPFIIKNFGTFNYGDSLSSDTGLKIEILHSNAILIIGDYCFFNSNLHIGVWSSVIIGDNVLVASNVYISDHSHGTYNLELSSSPACPPNQREVVAKPVVIGNNVWIGESVKILPGVSLGDGCIVGAGSVVTKSFPANTIIAGVPAVAIKCYDSKLNKWVNV